MGEEGLKILRDTGDKHGLPVVTEVMDPRRVRNRRRVCRRAPNRRPQHAEFLTLLTEVGQTRKPVLLKLAA